MHVTVIVPTYNGERFVRQAVRSALEQSHPDLDVLVVDDGSTDATCDVIACIGSPRVTLLTQRNAGVAAARNRGLQAAEGDVVAFLDQDDVWFPNKLALQLPLLTKEVGAVGALMTYLGPRGPVRATAGDVADEAQGEIARGQLMPFPISSMICPTDFLRDLGGFDEALVQEVGPIDDLDLMARIAQRRILRTVAQPLGFYRIHDVAGSFSRFHDMQRGTRFLQARIAARQSGGDLDWPTWSSRSPNTLRRRRRDQAKFYYRSAGLAVASGERRPAVVKLLLALVLAPDYVVRRLLHQRRTSRATGPPLSSPRATEQ